MIVVVILLIVLFLLLRRSGKKHKEIEAARKASQSSSSSVMSDVKISYHFVEPERNIPPSQGDYAKNISSVMSDVKISYHFVEPERDVPPSQGDYAKTIFLWYFKKPQSISKAIYPNYFLYECGIKNPAVYHKKMIDEGYFIPSTDMEKLNLLKIPELKNILSEHGLTTTGKKSALIQRILDNSSVQSLPQQTPDVYSLSEKGLAFLASHEDYIKLHKHKEYEVGWQEYDLEHKDGFDFSDTIWRILNKRIIQDKEHFGRREYHLMSQILTDEGKRPEALEMLLRVLYIDLSDRNNILPFAPGIIGAISTYNDVFSEDMVERLYQSKFPRRTCSKELFMKIIQNIMNNTFDEQLAEKEWKKDMRKPLPKT